MLNTPQVAVCKRFVFEAAHFLPSHPGKCANLHGHSYKMEVEVTGAIDRVTGMVVDFSELKKTVEALVVDVYDHKTLNEFFEVPTAELMVAHIFERLRSVFPGLVRVRLFETENSYAECSVPAQVAMDYYSKVTAQQLIDDFLNDKSLD